MSIDLMTQVWKSDAYEGGTLLVLLALADWASDDGTSIFPKVATLGKKARLCERQVQNCLANLRKDGVLIKVAAARRGRGTEYRLDIEGVKNLHRKDCAANSSGETRRVDGVQSIAGVGVQSTSPPIREPLVEPPLNRHSNARESADAGAPEEAIPDPLENWVSIWAACQAWPGLPPSGTEARAQQSYLRCKPELPPDTELIGCINAQCRAYVEANTQRKPHQGRLLIAAPHNWLERDKGWRAFIDMVRAEPARVAADVQRTAAARAGFPPSILAKLNAQGIREPEIDSWFDGAMFEYGPPPRLSVSSDFKRNYIRNNFRGKLERALGADVVVDLVTGKAAAKAA